MTRGLSGCIGIHGCLSTTNALQWHKHNTRGLSQADGFKTPRCIILSKYPCVRHLFMRLRKRSTIFSSRAGRCWTMGSPLYETFCWSSSSFFICCLICSWDSANDVILKERVIVREKMWKSENSLCDMQCHQQTCASLSRSSHKNNTHSSKALNASILCTLVLVYFTALLKSQLWLCRICRLTINMAARIVVLSARQITSYCIYSI